MATIFLTGVTGNVSSAVVQELQGAGHKLVGLVRDPAKPQAQSMKACGVELRTGDLSKPRTVEGAFAGVDVAFLLTPRGELAPYQASNALWGARQGGVKHIVRLSAVGAAHDAPTLNSRLHALSDTELVESGIPYTIVKPHLFLNSLLSTAKTVVEQGAIHFALGAAAQPMIDVRDIAASVAAILQAPASHAGKTYTLTGPVAISMHEVASEISAVIGKSVKYVAVPVDAFVEQLSKFGMDDYSQVAMRDYFTAYSQGWSSDVTRTVVELTGRPPIGLHEFVRDFAGVFGKR
jgi:uncharacterized protein YbjT (DUF2867 family)